MRGVQKIGKVLLIGCVAIGLANSAALHKGYAKEPLTAIFSISDTALKSDEIAWITFMFSEPVSEFGLDSLSVSNGTVSDLHPVSQDRRTWVANLTPAANVTSANNVIVLDYSRLKDELGNPGTGIAVSSNYAIDTLRPTLAEGIGISETALKSGDSANVTFKFAEPVTGFTIEDLTVPNGILSGLTSSDGGITWTATLTPDSGVADMTNVLTLHYGGLADLAGNAGTGTADSPNYAVETAGPSARSVTVSDTMLTIGETADVTFVFTEAVSGFTTADLSVPDGTIDPLSSSDGGITWTGTLTPNANRQAAGSVITLNHAGIFNFLGDPGVGTKESNAYDVDTLRPTATISLSPKKLNVGATAEVTIAFSEAVTAFTKEDLTASNGILSLVTSADGGRTWTATLTPKADVASKVNNVVLENAAIIDLAGNLGTGTTSSEDYEVQTVVPKAAVTVADSTLTAGKTSPVKIVFTEPVTGLAVDDFTVDNGTLSNLASADGGITWTAVLTPASDTDAAINRLSLRNEGFVSAAGNTGVGTTLSNAYAVKTVTPSGGEPASPPTPPPVFYAPPVFVPVDQLPGIALIVSNDGVLTLPAGRAGTVNLEDAIRVEVPAGAAAKELKLSIDRVTDTRNLLNNGEILASPVFELFKSSPENLDKPLKLSLSFEPAAVTGDRKAAVFFYDETRKAWTEVKGGTLQGNRVTVDVDRFAKYAVLAAEEKKPTDTPDVANPQDIALRDLSGHWSEAAVKQAIGEGLVSGYPDGTFRPDTLVTRAEYALMLMNALNSQTSGAAVNFTDASEIGAWAQTAVSQAVQLGILNGYADGSLRPNAGITRAEMAVMAARALKLSAGSGERTSFSDDSSIPAWAKDAAEALKKAGVLQGTGANAFKPAAQTTRAEAVTLLVNLRNRNE